MKGARAKFFLLHTLLPVVVGGSIYTLWRTPTLLVFKWYDAAGLQSFINQLRLSTSGGYGLLPHWLFFSLPDGLWVYALTSLMAGIWRESKSTSLKVAWTSSGLLLGVGGEIGQLAGLVRGTFDYADLGVCCLASFCGVILHHRIR